MQTSVMTGHRCLRVMTDICQGIHVQTHAPGLLAEAVEEILSLPITRSFTVSVDMRSSIIRKFVRNYISQTHYGRPDFLGECGVDHPYPFRRRVPVHPKMNFAVSYSDDIRAEFLAYFRERNHTLVAPSSVYPRHIEGSYFINAGTDEGQKPEGAFANLTKAANSQPCIRIGGRHDDLNDVGYDTSHHTMFEMLGNWSFGSYGREVACRQMWHFLTEVLRIPKSALYVTFFDGSRELKLPPDDEAREIWFDIGVSDRKLMAIAGKSNFWQADEASGGLCGPCTEIHVDYSALNGKRDMTCARCLVNNRNPRVVEIWNCVFITHRMAKGPNGETVLEELPAISVDTGLGLERLASVMQVLPTATLVLAVNAPISQCSFQHDLSLSIPAPKQYSIPKSRLLDHQANQLKALWSHIDLSLAGSIPAISFLDGFIFKVIEGHISQIRNIRYHYLLR
ncbi:hypothetical protein ACTXT7_003393 [Hymenolepis weldensis]